MEAKKKKRPPIGQQSSQYDKIFKENLEAVISSIMQNILEITAVSVEELPDDIQHTKERKPDVLKKVTDNQGDTFVLQIEFQVANDDEMVHRMLDYKAMLIRKYRLPIYQYVIFLGKGQPKMETHLTDVGLTFEYNLLSINSVDYKIFLKSNRPEEIVLSVLANFGQETSENALKDIILRLEETTSGDLALKRYFKQLRILAQLRKLEQKLKNIVMDSIAKYIDEKRDVAFLIGQEKTEERIVRNLLSKMSLTLEQIAEIAGVTVGFVKSVQRQLTEK
ncbi:hypothetical protein FHS57_004048 [Runella defluvii]|uniref:Rpn family recombination-promoting nuclease/putative transposase n=1 Tax=Runella defluvii TaxID=370973 RepID=A0A7W5ZMH7_9BACT|nr:hypothetical protein [Runella defluvii]MBB3840035.1 hypothetical protein [Runella defluvii]